MVDNTSSYRLIIHTSYGDLSILSSLNLLTLSKCLGFWSQVGKPKAIVGLRLEIIHDENCLGSPILRNIHMLVNRGKSPAPIEAAPPARCACRMSFAATARFAWPNHVNQSANLWWYGMTKLSITAPRTPTDHVQSAMWRVADELTLTHEQLGNHHHSWIDVQLN